MCMFKITKGRIRLFGDFQKLFALIERVVIKVEDPEPDPNLQNKNYMDSSQKQPPMVLILDGNSEPETN